MHILFNVLMDVTAVEGPDGSTSIRMSGGTDPHALDLPLPYLIVGYAVIIACILFILVKLVKAIRLRFFSKTISTIANVESKFIEEYEDYDMLNAGRGKLYLRPNKGMFEKNKSYRVIFKTIDNKTVDLAMSKDNYERLNIGDSKNLTFKGNDFIDFK